MDFNEYQKKAVSTSIYGAGWEITYPALGLVGEAGEVANKVKKVLRDQDGVFTEYNKTMISEEIGDVLWYCAALARDLGIDLETIAQGNIAKLLDRQARNVIGGSGDKR